MPDGSDPHPKIETLLAPEGSDPDLMQPVGVGEVASELLRREAVDDRRSLLLISDLRMVARGKQVDVIACRLFPPELGESLRFPIVYPVPGAPRERKT